MKKILFILIPVILFIIGYSFFEGNSNEDYIKQTLTKRAEKINFLASSQQSPFKQNNKLFEEPEYFPISIEYQIRAKLQRLSDPQRVMIQNSDGTSNAYLKFAYANFKLSDQELQLLILKPAGFGKMNTYFTAFADNTSGRTTYGGGRYLDLEIGKSDNIIIDFNLAYNPYCAYVPSYSCPLPPAENILPITINAGEKDYKH